MKSVVIRWVLATLLLASCSGAGGRDNSAEDSTAVPDQVLSDTQSQSDVLTCLDCEAKPDDVFQPPDECDLDSQCDDANPCTTDRCLEGECAYQWTNASCDDGDLCTTGDACVEGRCQGTPLECNDGNECTTDSCKKGECSHVASVESECALTIAITSPFRAATLQTTGSVGVVGKVVSPAAPVASMTLNGQDVALDSSGKFQVNLSPFVGINILEAEVRDGLERRARAVQSFLFSEGLRPHGAGTSLVPIDDGSLVWVDQIILDDDNLWDLDDLATVVYEVVSTLDVNEFIPNPLFAEGEGPSMAWCEWDVAVTNIQYDVGPVEIDAIWGGLHIEASLVDVSADFSAVADWCPDAIGTIYADLISIELEVMVDVTSSGAVDLETANVVVIISGLQADITDGIASYFDWIINWFDETISGILQDELEAWFAENLNPMLAALLQDFTSFQTEFDLPTIAGNAPGSPVGISVAPSAIDFKPGGGRLALDVGTGCVAATTHPALGSLRRGDCSGDDPLPFFLPETDPLEAALSEDLVNQILYSLWVGGHLNLTLTDQALGGALDGYGVSSLTMEIDPLLPPVITTCGEEGGIQVQFGDLKLNGDFVMLDQPGTVELFASAAVEVSPQVKPGDNGVNVVGLSVTGVNRLAVQVVSSSGVAVGAEELIEGLLVAVIVDTLVGAYLSDVLSSYPIPVLDLGDYVIGLPYGSNVTFNPITIEANHGYFLVGGAVANP